MEARRRLALQQAALDPFELLNGREVVGPGEPGRGEVSERDPVWVADRGVAPGSGTSARCQARSAVFASATRTSPPQIAPSVP
ncbi:MAG: hypothetical protein R2715_00235 [Ilumatobacteraceae bacterium]